MAVDAQEPVVEVHQLDVSREGIVATLKDQFTDEYTFIGEALQNARRAGAREVSIHLRQLEGGRFRMVIEDDGRGIADFSRLMRLGKSGWDPDVMEREHPYGVGFAALLGAAEEIEILTENYHLEPVKSEDILSFRPVEVKRGPTGMDGTRIEMLLNQDYDDSREIVTAIERKACGFPVEIRLTTECGLEHGYEGAGKVVSRPLSEESLEQCLRWDTAFGRVYFRPDHLPEEHTAQDSVCTAFLQGLPVVVGGVHERKPLVRFDESAPFVVHFDESRVRARMPDRDMVLDAHEVRDWWTKSFRGFLRDWLVQEKERLSPEAFSNRHWDRCGKWAPDLLCDAPLPPNILLRAVRTKSIREEESWWGDKEWVEDWKGPIPGEDGLFFSEDASANENQVATTYAAVTGIPIVKGQIPKTHWVRGRSLSLFELPVGWEMKGEVRRGRFNGSWICDLDVAVCDHVELFIDEGRAEEMDEHERRLLSGLRRVKVSDLAFYDNEEGVLVVPSGVNLSFTSIARLASSFVDEYETHQEYEEERDEASLCALIRSLRENDLVSYLEHEVQRMSRALDGEKFVDGQRFILTWDSKNSRFLVAPEASEEMVPDGPGGMTHG